MERISIEQVLMECALSFAKRSTCQRVKAGAVIAFDNHIISTGYNGNAPGREHCCDYWQKFYDSKASWKLQWPTYEDYLKSDSFKSSHREWSQKYELHAEMNAIIYAARRGIKIEGADIYTTYSPCIFCAKAIIHAGISRVFYHVLYDRPEGKEALEVLRENSIIMKEI